MMDDWHKHRTLRIKKTEDDIMNAEKIEQIAGEIADRQYAYDCAEKRFLATMTKEILTKHLAAPPAEGDAVCLYCGKTKDKHTPLSHWCTPVEDTANHKRFTPAPVAEQKPDYISNPSPDASAEDINAVGKILVETTKKVCAQQKPEPIALKECCENCRFLYVSSCNGPCRSCRHNPIDSQPDAKSYFEPPTGGVVDTSKPEPEAETCSICRHKSTCTSEENRIWPNTKCCDAFELEQPKQPVAKSCGNCSTDCHFIDNKKHNVCELWQPQTKKVKQPKQAEGEGILAPSAGYCGEIVPIPDHAKILIDLDVRITKLEVSNKTQDIVNRSIADATEKQVEINESCHKWPVAFEGKDYMPLLEAIVDHIGHLQVHPFYTENIKKSCVVIKAELAKLRSGK